MTENTSDSFSPQELARIQQAKPAAPQAARFVELFNAIDRQLRQLDGEPSYMPFSRRVQKLAKRLPTVAAWQDELMLMADIRNLIVHESVADINPVVEPHAALVARFETLLRLLARPPLALEQVAMPLASIYTAAPKAPVGKVMAEMYKRGFSHVPVLEAGRVVGVFSQYTVFAWLVETGKQLPPQMTLGELWETIRQAAHHDQEERYRFLPRSLTTLEAEDIFWRHTRQNRRLSVLFITETGEKSEPLLGMITAADMAGYRLR